MSHGWKIGRGFVLTAKMDRPIQIREVTGTEHFRPARFDQGICAL